MINMNAASTIKCIVYNSYNKCSEFEQSEHKPS